MSTDEFKRYFYSQVIAEKPATVADACGMVADRTRDAQAEHVLRQAKGELERLTREVAVRDRALEIGEASVAHLSDADARAATWLTQARAEMADG